MLNYEANHDIELERMLQVVRTQPWNPASHRELREVALQRKASGGRDLGLLRKLKFLWVPSNPVAAMLQAETRMSYDPANPKHLVMMHHHALRAGLDEVADWIREQIDRMP